MAKKQASGIGAKDENSIKPGKGEPMTPGQKDAAKKHKSKGSSKEEMKGGGAGPVPKKIGIKKGMKDC